MKKKHKINQNLQYSYFRGVRMRNTAFRGTKQIGASVSTYMK